MKNKMGRFINKSGIITGASRGLGKAMAKAFASEGACVGIGYYRNQNEAELTVKEIEQSGGNAILVKADIKNEEETANAFSSFIKERGGIDFLINNAGIIYDQPFALMSKNSWSLVTQTNLEGTFHCTRAVVRSMIAKKAGVIINISSVAGSKANPGQVNYAASKGGIEAMSRTLAAELAPMGIRVNTVVPGCLKGGMTQRLDRRAIDALKNQIPLKRLGELDEVVKAVLFLSSDDASYIVGQSIMVDGGLSV
ncbi:SDR family oxidoreductase [Labilibacter sediminis]|nr:SDR family oxidoreductase [Labilibacter sediminis]